MHRLAKHTIYIIILVGVGMNASGIPVADGSCRSRRDSYSTYSGIPRSTFTEVTVKASGSNTSSTKSSSSATNNHQVSIIVDGTRFNIDVDLLRSKPNTMLGRYVLCSTVLTRNRLLVSHLKTSLNYVNFVFISPAIAIQLLVRALNLVAHASINTIKSCLLLTFV